MSHFFSFLYQGVHNQTRQLLVVLLLSTLSTFGVTFSDVLAPLIGVLMATLNVVHFGAT